MRCIDANFGPPGCASQSTQQHPRPHLSLAAAAVDAANTKPRNCKAPPCLWRLPLTVNIQLSIGRFEGRKEKLCNLIKLTERESELCKISPLSVQKIDMSGEVGATSEETHHQVPIFRPSTGGMSSESDHRSEDSRQNGLHESPLHKP